MNPLPDFYDPDRIGTLFYPDMARIAAAAAAANLPPAMDDERIVHLLLVDMQVDFCHPAGALYVPGAQDDIRRVIELIYANAARITRITCSLDSHLPTQIFSPSWWADPDGNHPDPFTVIAARDVATGRWRPLRDAEWSHEYVQRLEREAKKQLIIWPYHVLIGGVGNALDPELWSAVFWHALARHTQPHWLVKGTIPRTEHYSIIQPEVPVPGVPRGEKNQTFLDELILADEILVAGEAESHCVQETLEDIVEEFRERPELLAKVRLLRDCTSPVVHPEIDFHALAQAKLAEFEAAGMGSGVSTDVNLL